MITMVTEFRMELGGRPLVLEFGGLAKQANGSVLVRYGDTAVLVAATMSKEPREGIDFFSVVSRLRRAPVFGGGENPRWLGGQAGGKAE